jgi:hypothetical protein
MILFAIKLAPTSENSASLFRLCRTPVRHIVVFCRWETRTAWVTDREREQSQPADRTQGSRQRERDRALEQSGALSFWSVTPIERSSDIHGFFTLTVAGCGHPARSVSARPIHCPQAWKTPWLRVHNSPWPGRSVSELPLILGHKSSGLKTCPFAPLWSVRNSVASRTWLWWSVE